MPKPKILLFGASGFIGRNLQDWWSTQGTVKIVAPSSRECNLLDEQQTAKTIADTQPDFIINAAHPGVNSSAAYSDEYIFNTLSIVSHIARGATKAKNLKKIFMFGSGLEYGDDAAPITEEHALNPKNVYATTKTMSSLLALDLAREFKVPLVVLRLFNLYGPYDNKGVGYYLISTALKGSELKITQGEQIRDFLFVKDLVQLINHCLQSHQQLQNGAVYNLASGQPTPLAHLVNEVLRQLSFSGPINYLDYKPNEYWHNVADINKIQRVFPVGKLTPLAAGVQKTIEWVKNQSSSS